MGITTLRHFKVHNLFLINSFCLLTLFRFHFKDWYSSIKTFIGDPQYFKLSLVYGDGHSKRECGFFGVLVNTLSVPKANHKQS